MGSSATIDWHQTVVAPGGRPIQPDIKEILVRSSFSSTTFANVKSRDGIIPASGDPGNNIAFCIRCSATSFVANSGELLLATLETLEEAAWRVLDDADDAEDGGPETARGGSTIGPGLKDC